LDVLNVLGVTRRVQLCMFEVVEGGLCLLDVLDVMRCMLLCMLEAVEGGSVCGTGGAGGDTLCTTLYTGGCGG